MRTDETGLHAEDCDCPTCETGFRPTELERACARRALAARAALIGRPPPKNKAEVKALADEERHRAEVKATAEIAARLAAPVAPWTPEEAEQARELAKRCGRG